MGFLSKLFGWEKKDKPSIERSNALVSSVPSCPYRSTYVILDTETTGLSPTDDTIVQLTAIKYDCTGSVIECYDTYLNPGFPIPSHVTNINGITDAMVRHAPKASEIEKQFLSFLGDSLIVGYNVTFDLRFLQATFEHSFHGLRYVDVLTIVRQTLDMSSYKLGDVSREIGFHPTGSYHNARTDCEAVAAILHYIGGDLDLWEREFYAPTQSTEYIQVSPVLEDGYENWQQGDALRVSGKIDEALIQFDVARSKGYIKPWLYESYAKAFRKLKEYEKEAAVLQEAIEQFEGPVAEGFAQRRQRAQELQLSKERRDAEEKGRAERRQLRAEAKLRKQETIKNNPKQLATRRVIQYLDDGTVVKEYSSVASASRDSGVNQKCIRDTANGKQKHAGGYCWRYVDSTEPGG